MFKEEFVRLIDSKIKLIRTEKSLSQDKMAEAIGISKKTLIEVEKGRKSLGWTTAVAVCTIFIDSEILEAALGGDVTYIIQSLSFISYNKEYPQTLGGKVFWRDIKAECGYKIQQNIISSHYRILDSNDRRICSSFDRNYVERRLFELNNNGGDIS